jgi:hypothetical protein
MRDQTDEIPPPDRMSVAGWIALVVLVAFFIAALVYAIKAWGELAGTGMSTAGWIFMICGIVFTIALGGGLMALLFYSSRNDYDR